MPPPLLGGWGRLLRQGLPSTAVWQCINAFSVERCLNGGVKLLGPILILMATVLIGISVFGYFWWLIPFHYGRPETASNWATKISGVFWTLIGAWLSILIIFNYYAAITVRPGSPPRDIQGPGISGHDSDDDDDEDDNGDHEVGAVTIQIQEREQRRVCKRCQCVKYERQHHCSVCDRCIYKMDHHCPWINGCVGHKNHRFFYLFMAYLWIGCLLFIAFSFRPFVMAIGWDPSATAPMDLGEHGRFRGFIVLFFMLSVALSMALGALVFIHTYLILSNQTTIELYGNGCSLCRLLLRLPMRFNDYDLGWRRNLQLFFNTIHHPWWMALLPVKVPAYGDGTAYPNARVLPSFAR